MINFKDTETHLFFKGMYIKHWDGLLLKFARFIRPTLTYFDKNIFTTIKAYLTML